MSARRVVRRGPVAAALAVIVAGALSGVSPLRAADVTGPRAAQGRAGANAATREDSAAVASTVERFHRALAAGDSAGALALLAPDATILESGGAESVAEYRSHHLAADIDFARAVREARSPLRVRVRGDAAWVSSTSTAQGEFRGRAVNSAGAELMVLVRSADGWRIAAIHWSSRRRGT